MFVHHGYHHGYCYHGYLLPIKVARNRGAIALSSTLPPLRLGKAMGESEDMRSIERGQGGF